MTTSESAVIVREIRICAGKESGKRSEEKETRKNLKKLLKKLKKSRKPGLVIFTFRIRPDFHPEALFGMLIGPVGETFRIPSSGGGRLNVTGFYSRDNRSESFCSERTIHSGVLLRCSDEFSKTLIKNFCIY